MRVEIREGPEFRAELIRAIEPRMRQPLDALAMAQVYLSDLVQQLNTHGGPPSEAEIKRRKPEGWWWLYVRGIWIGFISHERIRLLQRVRVITLLAVETAEP